MNNTKYEINFRSLQFSIQKNSQKVYHNATKKRNAKLHYINNNFT